MRAFSLIVLAGILTMAPAAALADALADTTPHQRVRSRVEDRTSIRDRAGIKLDRMRAAHQPTSRVQTLRRNAAERAISRTPVQHIAPAHQARFQKRGTDHRDLTRRSWHDRHHGDRHHTFQRGPFIRHYGYRPYFEHHKPYFYSHRSYFYKHHPSLSLIYRYKASKHHLGLGLHSSHSLHRFHHRFHHRRYHHPHLSTGIQLHFRFD